jgi:hypothetical protein
MGDRALAGGEFFGARKRHLSNENKAPACESFITGLRVWNTELSAVPCVAIAPLPAVRRADAPSGSPYRPTGIITMSKKAAEHHKKASQHHTEAARHHGEAAKHHESGAHEKAAHHAHTAGGHASHARDFAEQARKAHVEEHGQK